MGGYNFLFGTALWALPLAGLPVLLHLLFRRKSPVVVFSTLRFIKISVQETAARRRVRRWLLLALRGLLILLLVLVAAQPAKILASGSAARGGSSVAAIVVDTSYSMLLQQTQTTLLSRADETVQALLRDGLRSAKVAVFTSQGGPDQDEAVLRDAGDLSGQWAPLRPTPSPSPLSERISHAAEFLKREPGEGKWLIIISDLQKHEFPRQLPALPGMRVALLDLHPKGADSAGVTRVAIDPPQPMPGIGCDVVVDVTGPPAEAKPVNGSVAKIDAGTSGALGPSAGTSGEGKGGGRSSGTEEPPPKPFPGIAGREGVASPPPEGGVTPADGRQLLELPPQVVTTDATGHGRLRFPARLPSERWALIRASLGADDEMPWDNTRDLLIEAPPRQRVDVLADAQDPVALRVIRLALDPMQGKTSTWPLVVRAAEKVAPDANAVVTIFNRWPDAVRAASLLGFVRGGGTLVLFLRPGLEQTWASLPGDLQRQLRELLPAAPLPSDTADASPNTLAPATLTDPLLQGLTDKRFAIDAVSVFRFVPFGPVDAAAAPLLDIHPADPQPGLHSHGLLFRRRQVGTVYTFATTPDQDYTNLATHPLFLPLLVRMCLAPPAASTAQNVEIGTPLTLASGPVSGLKTVRIQNPRGEISAVTASSQPDGSQRFVFTHDELPGIYAWRRPDDDSVVALANVQLPAAESELIYTKAQELFATGEKVTVAQSPEELTPHLSGSREAQPQWTPIVAALLLLLCAETFAGSLGRGGKRQHAAPATAVPAAPR